MRLHGGWEFADGTVPDPDDVFGEPVSVTVAGVIATWDSPSAGAVRAAVMLRDLPRSSVGWDGSTVRCEWALVAEAEHPWTHRSVSPLLWLGVAGGDVTEHLGDEASPLVKLALRGPAPVPAAQVMPVRKMPPDRLKDVLARITAPDRADGLLITTSEQAGMLTGVMLAEETIVLWPGLVGLIVVDEEGRRRLAEHLPERPIPASGARWFAPATDSIGDQVLRGRQMTRPNVLARLVDRALRTRADTAPAGLAVDAAALLDTGGRLTVPAAPDRMQLLRDRITALAEELEQARTLLQQRGAQLDAQNHQLRAAREHGTRLERDLTAANERLAERDILIEDLTRQLDAAHAEADRSAAAAEQADEQLAEALRSRALLARQVARSGDGLPGEADVDEPVHEDFGALIAAARNRFPLLVMDDLAEDVARSLDQHPQAAAWRRRAWDALSTLDSYARARLRGNAVGDLLSYCRSGAPGVVIAAGSIASGENEGVRADERFRRARTFPVAPATEPRGEAFFGAHIRLGSGRPPAPRLHFLDDTGRTGRVYIGYIGPHLPNRRTN